MSDPRRDSDFSRQEPAGVAGGGFDLGRFDPKALARAGLGSVDEQERFKRALNASGAEASPARERGHPMNAYGREKRPKGSGPTSPGHSSAGAAPPSPQLAAPDLDRKPAPSTNPAIPPAVAQETAMPQSHVVADDKLISRGDDVMGLYEDFMDGLLGSIEPVLEQADAAAESVAAASVDAPLAVDESAELRGEQPAAADRGEQTERGADSAADRFRSQIGLRSLPAASLDGGADSERANDDTPPTADVDVGVGGLNRDLDAVQREPTLLESADALVALVVPSLPPLVELPPTLVPRVKLPVAAQAAGTADDAKVADAEHDERFKQLITQADAAMASEKAAFRTRMRGLRPFFGADPEDPKSRKRFEDFLMFINERRISGDNPAFVLFELMGVTKAISDAGIDGIRRADAQTGVGIATVAQALLDGLADQGDAVSGNMRDALSAATRQLHELLSSFAAQGAVTHQALENSARKATKASADLSELVEDIPLDRGRSLREVVDDAEDRLKGFFALAIADAKDRAEHYADGVNKGLQDHAQDTVEKSLGSVEKTLDRAVEFIEQIDDRFNTQRRYIDGLIEDGRLQLVKTGEAMSGKATKDVMSAINEATARSVKELNAAAVSAANTYNTLRQAGDEQRAKKERFASAVTNAAVSIVVCGGCVLLYAVVKAVFF